MVLVGDVDMSTSVRFDIGVTFVGDGAGGDSGDATADDDDRARCMLSRAASIRERTSRCSRIFWCTSIGSLGCGWRLAGIAPLARAAASLAGE